MMMHLLQARPGRTYKIADGGVPLGTLMESLHADVRSDEPTLWPSWRCENDRCNVRAVRFRELPEGEGGVVEVGVAACPRCGRPLVFTGFLSYVTLVPTDLPAEGARTVEAPTRRPR
jgi:hypothetical protein